MDHMIEEFVTCSMYRFVLLKIENSFHGDRFFVNKETDKNCFTVIYLICTCLASNTCHLEYFISCV